MSGIQGWFAGMLLVIGGTDWDVRFNPGFPMIYHLFLTGLGVSGKAIEK